MSIKKRVLSLVLLSVIVFTTACSGKNNNDESSSIPTQTTPIEETRGGLDLSEVNLTSSVNPDFKLEIEAEVANFYGNTRVESNKNGFSGDGYVVGLEKEDSDYFEIEVEVDEDGLYDFNFKTMSFGGEKTNYVILDGEHIGSIKTTNTSEFADTIYKKVFLSKGKHLVGLKASWGWIAVDKLIVTGSQPESLDMYEVTSKLINPNASENTRRLYNFLSETYGKYILTGQQADDGLESFEVMEIKEVTGKRPAIIGLDLMSATPSFVENGSNSDAYVRGAYWWREGGIVTLSWHWNAPQEYLINSSDQPWYRGFYNEAVKDLPLEKIMNGEDQAGYDLLIRDIDAIAVELKKFQENDIPILWRPLHEASGGWFWWGAHGPETYKKLWVLLYDRLTNYHEINNLIWVWNGQSKDWYPGDEYADIIGEDIYPGERVYSSQSGKFDEAVNYTTSNKIVAMTENGCVFDPDLAFRDNARWAWFCTWSHEFVIGKDSRYSEQYTEKEILKKMYNHERVLAMEDLPKISTYPIGDK